jgi:hypothetical protein
VGIHLQPRGFALLNRRWINLQNFTRLAGASVAVLSITTILLGTVSGADAVFIGTFAALTLGALAIELVVVRRRRKAAPPPGRDEL